MESDRPRPRANGNPNPGRQTASRRGRRRQKARMFGGFFLPESQNKSTGRDPETFPPATRTPDHVRCLSPPRKRHRPTSGVFPKRAKDTGPRPVSFPNAEKTPAHVRCPFPPAEEHRTWSGVFPPRGKDTDPCPVSFPNTERTPDHVRCSSHPHTGRHTSFIVLVWGVAGQRAPWPPESSMACGAAGWQNTRHADKIQPSRQPVVVAYAAHAIAAGHAAAAI